jgi:hypothetical protein
MGKRTPMTLVIHLIFVSFLNQNKYTIANNKVSPGFYSALSRIFSIYKIDFVKGLISVPARGSPTLIHTIVAKAFSSTIF